MTRANRDSGQNMNTQDIGRIISSEGGFQGFVVTSLLNINHSVGTIEAEIVNHKERITALETMPHCDPPSPPLPMKTTNSKKQFKIGPGGISFTGFGAKDIVSLLILLGLLYLIAQRHGVVP